MTMCSKQWQKSCFLAGAVAAVLSLGFAGTPAGAADEKPVASAFFKVRRGQVRGLHMVASGYVNGKKKIFLRME